MRNADAPQRLLLLPDDLRYVPLRVPHQHHDLQQVLPKTEGHRRRPGRTERLGERPGHRRTVPTLLGRPRLLHAAANTKRRRADDDLLPLRQCRMRPPLEGMKPKPDLDLILLSYFDGLNEFQISQARGAEEKINRQHAKSDEA
ncbi:hypothetical protein L596_016716 [Steinernema carpocapsae]|uniref:Uncharacterized protein n=1 Tax=Steinernema carpocapsae TaxID=34508 RepID=A0A4U5NK23_STECR|nr:hypothetical protein L596_016716 [Steinernema carpocapsae]